MARNWLKLETIQEFQDEHKSNRAQFIEWGLQYPQHKDSIVLPLYELNESLEEKPLHLFSLVQTRVTIRGMIPDGEASVIENNERFDEETAIYDTLYAALTNLRAEVKTLKECLDDPLGTVSKLQLHLDAANKLNEGLDRKFGNLRLQHTELEHFLWSRGELEDQIKVLESSLKEKDEEIARISQQNNELRYPQSPEKIAETIDSADNLAISNQSSIIGKLEKEKSDLSEQLQMAIRERDEKHQKWLTAREDKENMRNVFISNEESRERLLEENGALCEQVAGLKAQRQPAAVSPARNNIRRISSAASVSRPRPSLTRTQERVIATVQHLRDDQLERLESDGAFEAVSIKVPGQGHHWVKGHWRRNPGTTVYESNDRI